MVQNSPEGSKVPFGFFKGSVAGGLHKWMSRSVRACARARVCVCVCVCVSVCLCVCVVFVFQCLARGSFKDLSAPLMVGGVGVQELSLMSLMISTCFEC